MHARMHSSSSLSHNLGKDKQALKMKRLDWMGRYVLFKCWYVYITSHIWAPWISLDLLMQRASLSLYSLTCIMPALSHSHCDMVCSLVYFSLPVFLSITCLHSAQNCFIYWSFIHSVCQWVTQTPSLSASLSLSSSVASLVFASLYSSPRNLARTNVTIPNCWNSRMDVADFTLRCRTWRRPEQCRRRVEMVVISAPWLMTRWGGCSKGEDVCMCVSLAFVREVYLGILVQYSTYWVTVH